VFCAIPGEGAVRTHDLPTCLSAGYTARHRRSAIHKEQILNNSDNNSRVRYLVVGEEADGQRIDNFLLNRLKGVPRSWVYRVLRRGEVRVNKGRVKPTRRLCIGDQVRIPPLRLAESASLPGPGAGMRRRIERAIVHEDDDLLVIDKPSGIAVHGGSGVSHGVIEILRALRPQARYLELAHRLDRDTSGLLLIAKRRSALVQLQKLQLAGRIEKRYLALLGGRWRQDRKTVDAPLRKNTLRSGERIVRVDPAGKDAITHFRVRQRLRDAMLVEARLETGRTHQIRVHAAHLGTPILGDAKYTEANAEALAREAGLKRLFLHAWRLDFPWEGRQGGYHLEAPLPTELQTVVDTLK